MQVNQARHTYPSEIDTARRCWRKWAYKYLGRFERQPQSPSQILGDACHNLHERWNKLGQAPERGRSLADNLMVEALPHVALPRSGATEGDDKFELTDSNGFPLKYGGRTDWKGSSGDLAKFAELDAFGIVPAVLDLKTSSDPFKYGLWTRDKYLDDTAAIVYLLREAVLAQADCVGGRWLYLKTPKKNEDGSFKEGGKVEAFPSDQVLGRDALGRAHLRVVAPFKRGIDELRERASREQIDPSAPLSHGGLPYNTDACRDFNKPCEFLQLCGGKFYASQVVSAGYNPVFGGEQNVTSLMQNPQAQFAPQGAPQFPGQAPAYQPPPPPAQFQGAPQQAPQGYAPPPAQFAPQGAPAYQPPPAPAPATHAAYVAAVQAPAQFAPQGYQPPAPPPAPGFQGVNAPEARQAYGAPGAQGVALAAQAPVQLPAAAPANDGRVSSAQALDALAILVKFLRQ